MDLWIYKSLLINALVIGGGGGVKVEVDIDGLFESSGEGLERLKM